LKERLARVHPKVRTAERVYLEETGKVEGTTNASNAFRATGRTTEELYQQATAIRERFAFGGALLGGFLGLVVGGKLVTLSVRRGRSDYEADRASCFACGRCYQYCPKQREQWKNGKELVVGR